jgi:AbrB family looped-hinge helix DNA binding protein
MGYPMDIVKVSPKFQVVVPKRVREAIGLKVGQRLGIVAIGDQLRLVPVRSPRSMRGFLKGMDSSLVRERDRDL